MSHAWKALEKLVARVLRGERVLRGADFSKKDVDVRVADFESLQIDAKYKKAGWAHHSYLKEIQEKYCHDPEDIPILVTKARGQRGAVVSLYLDDYGMILDAIRELREESVAE